MAPEVAGRDLLAIRGTVLGTIGKLYLRAGHHLQKKGISPWQSHPITRKEIRHTYLRKAPNALRELPLQLASLRRMRASQSRWDSQNRCQRLNKYTPNGTPSQWPGSQSDSLEPCFDAFVSSYGKSHSTRSRSMEQTKLPPYERLRKHLDGFMPKSFVEVEGMSRPQMDEKKICTVETN